MQHTVKSLRELGYSIRVHHIRKYELAPGHEVSMFPAMDKKVVCARGGVTDVAVTTPDGENVRGYAYCSDKDGYNKKRGVMIALGRALKQLFYSNKKVLDPNNYMDKDNPVNV